MWFRFLLMAMILMVSTGCSVLFTRPRPISAGKRDAMFPTRGLHLKQPVTIYWNEYRIPFIHARTDEDLAYALGLVHAHLRITQLELYRRASQGRLSEMVGPLAVNIDKTIRMLNPGRAAGEIIAVLPPETLIWVSRYLEGLNDYIGRMKERPPDMKFLGIKPEPWTLKELAAVWRLMAADVNWFQYFNFLRLQSSPGWEELWQKFIDEGSQSTPSFNVADLLDQPGLLPWQFTESGSNSLVISPDRSRNGSALMANDPHLGLSIPNIWILIGYQSPTYHAVGLSMPGLPVIALGRNPDIAWGGTNMRGLSSYLYKLGQEDLKDVQEEEQTIKVRWWFDTKVKIRNSAWGPIISDSPLLETGEPVALKWVGHEVSDEITSFLKANRAGDWNAFRAAFKDYAVSAQNLLFADRRGNIGQLLAFRQPIRKYHLDKNLFSDKENTWVGYKTPLDLPFALNPKKGFIASSNNRPTFTDEAIGWLFSPNDRIDRLYQLVNGQKKIQLSDLTAWQEDVYSINAHKLARKIVEKAIPSLLAEQGEIPKKIFETLSGWDGQYDVSSAGPVAFELVYFALAREYFSSIYPDEKLVKALLGESCTRSILYDALDHMDNAEATSLLIRSMKGIVVPFQKFPVWGDKHTLQVAHMLANVPVLGKRWVFEQYPVSGGNETLFKTNARTGMEASPSFYGSCARYISDLSDMDENYFVLLGGQDGWMTSPQTLDQIPLWKSGRYIRFPLRLSSIQKEFTKVVTLNPED